MFKLLVLASLVAVSLAAPAEIVSKSAQSTVVENKNDPLNPLDDTVVKKTSVQETVKSTDGTVAAAAVDKSIANLYNPYGPAFNPYSPFYNPNSLYNPYAYFNSYNPSSPYFFPGSPFSPLNPRSSAFNQYAPYNPYTPLNYNNYVAKSYYAY